MEINFIKNNLRRIGNEAGRLEYADPLSPLARNYSVS